MTESPVTAGNPALSLERIFKRWGSRIVLDGTTLEVPAGSLTWLGGPNGVGKTTLLRIAAGLIAADEGTVALHGLDPVVDRRAYQLRLGFLSAGDRGLYARLTVTQNLTFWAGLALIPAAETASAIERGIARFGLEDMGGSRVDRLSMGQRQRVRLAMSFLHEPDVVLLDEPHTSLDDAGLELLGRALGDLVARSGSAVVCSPSLAAAPLAYDDAHLIEGGRVVSA